MRYPVALVLSLIPAIGSAQTAVVRSGEHSTFSRLVIETPQLGEAWTIDAVDGGYVVRLGAAATDIDMSGLFRLIPRDRVASATVEGGQLTLGVTCACHIRAFLARPDALVVDVVDGPARRSTVFPTARLLPEPQAIVRPVARMVTAGSEQIASAPPAGVDLPLLPVRTSAPPLDLLPVAPAIPTPDADTSLTQAERAILESFARAATQGVFDFPARPVTPWTDRGGAAPIELTPVSDPMDGVPIPIIDGTPPAPGLVLRSAIAREVDTPPEHVSTCDDPSLADIMTWAENGAFSTLIPELRAAVTNAADYEQPEALISLAKAYVFYGFGQEALQALQMSGQDSAEVRLIDAMARVVDDLPTGPADLVAYRTCGPQIEPWIALASGRLDTSDERIKTAVMVGHGTLPDALRGHLGLRLAEIFIAADEVNMAAQILHGAELATTGQGYPAALAEAALSGLRDGVTAEARALDAVLSEDPRATPEAMTRRLDLALDLDEVPPDDTLALSAAIRFEAGGSAAGVDLAVAEIRALTAANQFETARRLWQDTSPDMTPEQGQTAYTAIIIGVSERAADGPFLTMAFTEDASALTVPARHAVARRVLDLGFASQALTFLNDDTPVDPMLRAQVYAALGQSADALIALQEVETPEAEALEATILGRTPTPSLAPTPEQAWQAGDWQSLQDVDDPLLRDAATALLAETPPTSDETRLADSRALLETSAKTRALTQDLLERFALTDPDISTQ